VRYGVTEAQMRVFLGDPPTRIAPPWYPQVRVLLDALQEAISEWLMYESNLAYVVDLERLGPAIFTRQKAYR
jgi:hypothetical protein